MRLFLLKVASKYADEATAILAETPELINFSSNSGTWTKTVTIKSSNGKALAARALASHLFEIFTHSRHER
jgi:hypothetical protein